MKTGITLAVGAIAVALAVVAFAKGGDDTAPVVENEAVAEEPAPEPEVAQLAAPQEPEEVTPVHEDLTVDEDGHIWGPLSFDNPQVKINGDGTVTVKKLARAYRMDGTMEEIPITGVLYPKRVPISSVKRVTDVMGEPRRLDKFARPKAGLGKRPAKNKPATGGTGQ